MHEINIRYPISKVLYYFIDLESLQYIKRVSIQLKFIFETFFFLDTRSVDGSLLAYPVASGEVLSLFCTTSARGGSAMERMW